jgi:RNA polymerase sigma-70 factor (ECF subfamily)
MSGVARLDNTPWGVDRDPTPVPQRVAWAFSSVQGDLLRYLRAVVGDDHAEDVASQVWLEMIDGAAAFRGDQAAFRRWIFTTARRRALDQRRRWWQRSVKLCAPGDRELELAAADEHRSIDREAAVARIGRLPKAQVEVVLLRVLGGFSAEEVAELTGRTPGSVRVIQHRALRRLADDLRRHPDGWPPA